MQRNANVHSCWHHYTVAAIQNGVWCKPEEALGDSECGSASAPFTFSLAQHLIAKAAAGSYWAVRPSRHGEAATVLKSSSTAADQQLPFNESFGGKTRQAMHRFTLRAQQLQMVVDASVGAALKSCPAEIFRCIELMSKQLLGATSVRLLYVSHWHQKLLHFAVHDPCNCGRPNTRTRENCTASHLPLHRVVCNVGEGIAGAVAHSGQSESISDCSVNRSATGKDCGSMVGQLLTAQACLACCSFSLPYMPELLQLSLYTLADNPYKGATNHDIMPLYLLQRTQIYWPVLQLSDPQGDVEDRRVVRAVLELWFEEGPFTSEALEVLEYIVRLAGAWLHSTLENGEDEAYCRTTEALLSLAQLSSHNMILDDLLEEIITAVQSVTKAEKVCLYMFDDIEDELWLARSLNVGLSTDEQMPPDSREWCSTAALITIINTVVCSTAAIKPAYVKNDVRIPKASHTHSSSSFICVPVPPPHVDDNLAAAALHQNLHHVPPRHQRQSRVASQSTPIAVLHISGKRGIGVFEQSDEEHLKLLSIEINELLRSRSVEVWLTVHQLFPTLFCAL
eukprot:8164-Heterococcus_DN1.PRE.5